MNYYAATSSKYNTNIPSSSSDDKVLLSINIELTDEETGVLEIRDKDNINFKINDFCKKYSLSDRLKDHLSSLVKQKIKKEIKECIISNI